MKKIDMALWLVAIIALTTVGLRACADTVNVSVRAVDQDGKPVAEAKINADAGDPVVANRQGVATMAIRKRALSNRFYAKCEGYYSTQTHENYCPLNPNVDLSQTVDVVLKKIKNPIPMYTKSLVAEQGGILKLPSYDGNAFGYDLMIGDWVAPHGKGKISDLIFKFEGNSGRVLELEEWKKNSPSHFQINTTAF